MVMHYNFIDIVIKRSSLEKIKQGLSSEFISEYKVEEGHYDENLIIIRGGMSDDAANDAIKNLTIKYNLVHMKNNFAIDVVCVWIGEIYGDCVWLKSGQLKEDIKIGNNVFPKNLPYYEYINDDKI